MHNFYKCGFFIYKMVEWLDEKLKNSFERKLKDWIDWSDNHIPDRMTPLDEKCFCGGKRYCCSADLGIVSYEPHSAHICDNPNCDYVEMEDSFSEPVKKIKTRSPLDIIEETKTRSPLEVVFPSINREIVFPDIYNQEHCEICKKSKKD